LDAFNGRFPMGNEFLKRHAVFGSVANTAARHAVALGITPVIVEAVYAVVQILAPYIVFGFPSFAFGVANYDVAWRRPAIEAWAAGNSFEFLPCEREFPFIIPSGGFIISEQAISAGLPFGEFVTVAASFAGPHGSIRCFADETTICASGFVDVMIRSAWEGLNMRKFDYLPYAACNGTRLHGDSCHGDSL
jgi:hypothetical protein